MKHSSEPEKDQWHKYAKIYDPVKCASIDGTDSEPHDRAVVRALNSEYRPNRFIKGKPECTIFISRLNHDTSKDTIKEVFSTYGKIKRFRLVRDVVTGMPKGYGFIEYEDEQSAEQAYRYADKMVIDGRPVFVDFECERLLKGWKPRRLGGGFGGKKESGQLRFGGRDRPFKKPIALELEGKRKREEADRRRDRERRVRDKERRTLNQNGTVKRKSKERSPLIPKRPPSPKPDKQCSQKKHHSNQEKPSREKNGESDYRASRNQQRSPEETLIKPSKRDGNRPVEPKKPPAPQRRPPSPDRRPTRHHSPVRRPPEPPNKRLAQSRTQRSPEYRPKRYSPTLRPYRGGSPKESERRRRLSPQRHFSSPKRYSPKGLRRPPSPVRQRSRSPLNRRRSNELPSWAEEKRYFGRPPSPSYPESSSPSRSSRRRRSFSPYNRSDLPTREEYSSRHRRTPTPERVRQDADRYVRREEQQQYYYENVAPVYSGIDNIHCPPTNRESANQFGALRGSQREEIGGYRPSQRQYDNYYRNIPGGSRERTFRD
ncbi:U1 small nuclear ribonucleoprotein 70 kDa-like [Anthonomus grandis grandis]|uniref:U1 small nuclear ribonucleoprotein 70 kDa-like n=1 Tax=Anthonomus grandis grandis TaxID=2921223 RepID=UPI00216529A6|nr:U1 small nuclear ribonucleoprotein 70 kDa-like [Anthonomus grandis grandis]XP_050303239.1 U1 small nuclear ribonucleoprotein 70 kDa-like [Anthonomus grandis grandis]XP_050303240.1 U1 small nuclear ribonucleoprotein 70 kDa-like [Anthonomus grandis grandis]XP_050303241.1 U1 small nuclear ribonucleoprotein 70 kDa-like [Anthonomus grandis grandis]